ncbi:dATP/dGTP diphosphohydrolase domain-containing protein [Nocardia asteroides]|uniref:dATP/dGTP diphosphohydrolase domain-containing protein n=1 Tax=Nocardia asteroides TaxID=1824 RepID=UPI0037CA3DBE
MPEEETRVISATGGEKGRKLARYGLIPADALRQIAEHYGRGAQKYDPDNWMRGYDWDLSFDAMMRHAWQFWGGEDRDDETGSLHTVAVAWHAITLTEFARTHREFDTRPARHILLRKP